VTMLSSWWVSNEAGAHVFPDNKPSDWAATTSWEQKLNDLVHELPPDGNPRFRESKWQDVFANQPERTPIQAIKDTWTGNLPRFSLPIGEERLPWTVWLSPEGLWKRFSTLSQVAVLRGGDREATRHRFDEVLKGEDVERDAQGRVACHGVTYFAWSDSL